MNDEERRDEDHVPEERPVSEQPDAEDRGVPGIERPPEGPPQLDRVGSGEPAGVPATVPDPAETPVPDELRAEIEDYMTRYPDRRSAVIPALHAAQRVHGWCSPLAMAQVAAETLVAVDRRELWLVDVLENAEFVQHHARPPHGSR